VVRGYAWTNISAYLDILAHIYINDTDRRDLALPFGLLDLLDLRGRRDLRDLLDRLDRLDLLDRLGLLGRLGLSERRQVDPGSSFLEIALWAGLVERGLPAGEPPQRWGTGDDIKRLTAIAPDFVARSRRIAMKHGYPDPFSGDPAE